MFLVSGSRDGDLLVVVVKLKKGFGMCENVSVLIVMCDAEEEAGRRGEGSSGVSPACQKRHITQQSKKQIQMGTYLSKQLSSIQPTDMYIFTF